ncbi:MAG: hypothetical protein NTY16_04525 [Deltaproteobacteria bacterium]|nr:hypothetical protein [Deltaproteobacteria bacterium]
MRKYLEKVQDFRFLPVFVLVSMAVGIAIGKWYGISNFALTPPIDAIKAIFQGTYQFTLANSLALGVVIGLFLMIYPAMTNVKIEDLGKAAVSPKQLLIVLFFNYLVAPFFMLFLAKCSSGMSPSMSLSLGRAYCSISAFLLWPVFSPGGSPSASWAKRDSGISRPIWTLFPSLGSSLP